MEAFRHLKEIFEFFFKITSFIFSPYLEHKYRPKKPESLKDKLWTALIYLSTWIVVIFVYVIYIYLFIYSPEPGKTGHLSDFIHRPPDEIVKSVIETAKGSIYFNLTFLVVLYFAIINHAEKHFLSGKVLHSDLSGLIKTLTLGKYDDCSSITEQEENQISIARKNVLAVVNNPNYYVLSIICASGWDFFGHGPPLGQIAPAPVEAPQVAKKKGWFSFPSKSKKPHVINNGYMLDVISQRYKHVRIILVNPASSACLERGQAYVDGKHKVLKNATDYAKGVQECIENLKIAYRKNPNIELRLVQEVPRWKVILVEGEAWVQSISQGQRSDHTPLFGFRKGDYSFYHPFWTLHDELWHSRESEIIDLGGYQDSAQTAKES